jgi:molecular chaperone GrpE
MNEQERFEDEAAEECCGGCKDADETAGDPEEEEDEVTGEIQDSELLKCEQEVQLWKDKYLRVQADIENVRRRMYKEQEQALWRAQADIFSQLLTVMDNFDRAQADLEKLNSNGQQNAALAGIALIRKDLATLFERVDVREMPVTKKFDPTLHEALVSVDAEGAESGDIVQILQKGYLFKGQVLRPAKVSVAR